MLPTTTRPPTRCHWPSNLCPSFHAHPGATSLPLPIPPHRPPEGWGGSKVGEALASGAWQPECDPQKPHLKKTNLWMRQWASVIPTLKWGQEKRLEACSPATHPGAYRSCLRNKVKKQAESQKSHAPDHTRAMAPCAPIFTHTDMHRQPQ